MSKHHGNGITRRDWLCLTGAAAVAGCSAPSPVEPIAFPKPTVPGPKRLSDKPNLIVFLTDSMRARELATYGCEWPTSPVLDDFAAQSIVYERCEAPCSWTKPSIGSIFTGVVPSTHQSIDNDLGKPLAERQVHALPSRYITMAESLRSVGYHTYWSLENPLVQSRLGYGQGFSPENYDYRWPPDPAGQVARMSAMLRDGLPEPFLLFIHMIDPHVPYLPPESITRELFGDIPEALIEGIAPEQETLIRGFQDFLVRMRRNPTLYGDEPRPDVEGLMNSEGAQAWRRLYASSVRNVDGLFGQFLDTLDETGILDRSVVIFTSDHGEAFREHDNIMHGHTLYEEETHVPLIVRPPGGAGGVRVSDPVSLMDLYPTFAAVGGAPAPAYLQGASLMDGDGSLLNQAGRMVFSETNRFSTNPGDWRVAAIRGTMKVYLQEGGVRAEAYDLANDPLETVNLAEGTVDSEVRRLHDDLRQAHEEHRRLAAAFGPPSVVQFEDIDDDREAIQDLESVGYV